jgi:chromosome segregation ATPase
MPEEETVNTESPQEGTEAEAPQVDAKESTLDTEAMRKELEKVRKEAAKYRTRNKSLEEQHEESKKAAERAKMDEVEAAKAETNDLKAQLEAAREEVKRSGWKASLTGRVANTDAALKLLDTDKHVNEDGEINVDALLKDYDFLAPPATGKAGVPPANSGATAKSGPLSPADFRGKDPDWIRANYHRLGKKA